MSRSLAVRFGLMLALGLLALATTSQAQVAFPAPSQAQQPALASAPAQPPPTAAEAEVPLEKLQRRRFSWGRFFLESLVGTAVGSGAAFGIYKGVCGDEPCIGGAVGGLAANIAITPLAVYATGRWTGGYGKLSSAYWGGAIGFGAGAAATPSGSMLGIAIGVTLMPFLSAAAFELNSNARANEALLRRSTIQPVASVLPGRDGLAGFSLGLRGQL